jgi:hypothetical protein
MRQPSTHVEICMGGIVKRIRTVGTNVGGHTSDLLEIILRAGRYTAKDDLFRHTTAHGHYHLVEQLLLGVKEALNGLL